MLDIDFTTGYGLTNLAVNINVKVYIKAVEIACDKAAKKGAEKVLKEAKRYLTAHAKYKTSRSKGAPKPGKLASEIKLEKSRFRGGGWAVEAQGPRNYDKFYATFVELGSIRNPTPIPFLRNTRTWVAGFDHTRRGRARRSRTAFII